jgi:streptogramin lyase
MRSAPLRRAVTAAVLAAIAVPAAAGAASFQTFSDLASSTNGVALGADGDVYVVEQYADRVTVLAPDGRLVRRVALPAGSSPRSAALGADGRVWISLSAASSNRGFARIATDGTMSTISTAALYDCGPVGLVPDPISAGMLFAAPDDGFGCGTHGIGFAKDGTGGQGGVPTGSAYDLEVAGGKVFEPLYDTDRIERRALTGSGTATMPEGTFPLTAGSEPDGIVLAGDGRLYVTLYGTGRVARLDPSAPNGTAPSEVASGLQQPFGIAASTDGGVYVASNGDARLLRIATADDAQRSIALPAGTHPWQVAASAAGDLWVTDNAKAQVIRVVDGAPIVASGSADGGLYTASIDPRGNDTTVSVEAVPADPAWPTVARPGPTIPAGIGPQPARVAVAGVQAGARYTLTVVATNARGTVRGPSVAITTPPPPGIPSGTPTSVTPAAKPKAKPKVDDLLSGVGAHQCLSRRALTARVRHPKGITVTRVQVRVGSRKAKTYKGKQLRVAIRLTGLPKGTVKVRFTIRLADGRTVAQTRTFHPCAPKAKHKPKAGARR